VRLRRADRHRAGSYPKSGPNAGGYTALVLMAAIVAGLYVMFRRRNWL